MSADLKISGITEAVKTRLKEWPYVVAKSAGLREDEATGEKTVVIKDEGLQEDTIGRLMAGKGFAIIISLMAEGEIRDQSDDRVCLDNKFAVRVQVNPARNSSEKGGANVDITEALEEVIGAMCQNPKHNGGERYKFLGYAFSNTTDGYIAYDITFLKDGVI